MAATHAAGASVLVRNVDELFGIKYLVDASEIVIDVSLLKYRNLTPLALKYGLWALKTGGILKIKDNGNSSYDSWPYEIPFSLLLQWCVKLTEREGCIREIDRARKEIIIERVSPILPPGWSAGIVFSGNASELEQLKKCVSALLNIPELSVRSGGEIVVCAPAEARDMLADIEGIDHLIYENKFSGRIPIADKKNYIVSHLTNPRVVVLHTRILLEPDSLSDAPREFDLLTPSVSVRNAKGVLEDYLCFEVCDLSVPGRMPKAMPFSIRSSGISNYLTLFRRGFAYLDGGVFFARKDIFSFAPLDAALAWGEAEDVEWCIRAAMHGCLIDFSERSKALSSTNKLPNHKLAQVYRRQLLPIISSIRQTKFALKDYFQRARGMR